MIVRNILYYLADSRVIAKLDIEDLLRNINDSMHTMVTTSETGVCTFCADGNEIFVLKTDNTVSNL